MTTDTTDTTADAVGDTRTDELNAPAPLPEQRRLGDFAPDLSQASTGSACVVTVEDRVVVVLRADRSGSGVQVHDPVRSVYTLPAGTPAVPMDDYRMCAKFLAAAASDLAGIHALDQDWLEDADARHRRDQDQLESVNAHHLRALDDALKDADTRHRKVLNDIRDYAVKRYLTGAICQDGLNDFLTTFGLPAYGPIRIAYTITGSYEVDADNADAVERDVCGYLKPDLSELDNVIDDSEFYDVQVDAFRDGHK